MHIPAPATDPNVPAPDTLRTEPPNATPEWKTIRVAGAELIEEDKALLTRLMHLAAWAVERYPAGDADYEVWDTAQFVDVTYNDMAEAVRDQAIWGAMNFVIGGHGEPTPEQTEAIIAALPLATSTAVVDFCLDRVALEVVREAALTTVLIFEGGRPITDYGRERLAERLADDEADDLPDDDGMGFICACCQAEEKVVCAECRDEEANG
ncbi:hypothetical protein [Actinoplanes sp. NPDC026623]|uniref:hypothetical protein n=1 Tax=Actinoplanes sp. NPDC026623 TaxID=3155610 RepID=UPI0033CF5AAD